MDDNVIPHAIRPLLRLPNGDKARLPQDVEMPARGWRRDLHHFSDQGHVDGERHGLGAPGIVEMNFGPIEIPQDRHADFAGHCLDLEGTIHFSIVSPLS